MPHIMAQSSAQRMRRLRERREEGIVLVRFQVNPSGIRLLAENGYFAPGAAIDSKNVSIALVKYINASLGASPNPPKKPKQRLGNFARTMRSWLF
jgi:hypothetical protein